MSDTFFSYSDRYRSGSFNMRHVVHWESAGEGYYRRYVIHLSTGKTVSIDPEEFYQFEKEFKKIEKGEKE